VIKVENCRGCGRIIYVHPVANLSVRLDTEPLTADEAVQVLIAGRNLWRVTSTSVSPVRPAELSALRKRGTTEGPSIVREHTCTAAGAPNAPSPVPGAASAPKGPEAGTQRLPADRSTRPASNPPTERSSAPAAAPRTSDRYHPCDGCSRPVTLDGPELYLAMELGAHVVWAMHADCQA
jgi:hypothetical protein